MPAIESTGKHDRREAEDVMHYRMLEVGVANGDLSIQRKARQAIRNVPLDVVVTEFLKAYASGDLPGRTPAPRTVELYVTHLLGDSGGLVPFWRASRRELGRVLIERWLESEQQRLSPDTLRLKLICARRVIDFAVSRGWHEPSVGEAVRGLRPPPSAAGRARRDGVPSLAEIQRLLGELSPTHWRVLAETQFRLGLRLGEVMALEPSWIDETNRSVTIALSSKFQTKSRRGRTIDGVDDDTLGLAEESARLIRQLRLKPSGYALAFKRACAKLAKSGTPWQFSSKTHALRSAYATESRKAGVPLHVVRDRMGHASEKTTERHYIGRQKTDGVVPFEGLPSTARPRLRLVKSA